jgi:hypothetical protein
MRWFALNALDEASLALNFGVANLARQTAQIAIKP